MTKYIVKFCCIFGFLLSSQAVNAAPNNTHMPIIAEVKAISYAAALVKFCPILSAIDYVSFMQDLLMVERVVTFEHGGIYKYITKNQQAAAQRATNAGQNCTEDVLLDIIKGNISMKKFSASSPLRDSLPRGHPEYPKLNQAFIFASYLQARLALVYQRKCHILNPYKQAELNQLLLKTQHDLQLIFRPEQIGRLNKRQSENELWIVEDECQKLAPFIDYAFNVMTDDIAYRLEILRDF